MMVAHPSSKPYQVPWLFTQSLGRDHICLAGLDRVVLTPSLHQPKAEGFVQVLKLECVSPVPAEEDLLADILIP